jgi:4-diphosphocytidyl-2-C-methyl-D-erythritol kinase
MPRIPVVLVNPQSEMPADKTAQVFRSLDAKPIEPRQLEPRSPGLFKDTDELIDYMAARKNDLSQAARSMCAAVAAVEETLQALPGVRLVRLSGAGPTCFAVFGSGADALRGARALAKSHAGWWVRAAWVG